MASQGRGDFDDSFGSSNHSSDSLPDDDLAGTEGVVPIHPFANLVQDDGFDDDDSFDNDGGGGYQEETVFGVLPSQRGVGQPGEGNLRMLGDDLLQDTIGIGSRMAAAGRVDESPTPASWAH